MWPRAHAQIILFLQVCHISTCMYYTFQVMLQVTLCTLYMHTIIIIFYSFIYLLAYVHTGTINSITLNINTCLVLLETCSNSLGWCAGSHW